MTTDRKNVATGSGSDVITMIVLVAIFYSLWPVSSELTDVVARLGYTARALTFAALPLLIGIITVANTRFSSAAIDPTRHVESAALEINGRFVDNTVQQLLLFSIATLALCTVLTPSGMRVIPGPDQPASRRGYRGLRWISACVPSRQSRPGSAISYAG